MRVMLEIHEGQVVRNLLENCLLALLTDAGAEVLVVTPGARVPAFVEKYSRPGVSFQYLLGDHALTRAEKTEARLGQALTGRGWAGSRRLLWRQVGEPLARRRATGEKQLLRSWRPTVVVSTHLSQLYGRGLVAVAHQMGIPTVGNLMSWDNVWKGLHVRPQTIACWSENNRQEICRLAGYEPEQVQAIGAPAFDAYLAEDAEWGRTEVCRRLDLDPARPLLLFATLGQFRQQIDETNPLEALLEAIDAGEIPGRPQLILRMHPWSRDAYFARFARRPDVRVTRYENYVPGLGWTPTREETILAGNLLRHADVLISPGSTMCVEAAIFDTPTVVPVFNEYMPEVFDAYFERTWLQQHFRRLYQNDWVPIVRSRVAMIAAVQHALRESGWYAAGRKQIRDEFLGPLDGRATNRLADIILAAAK
jgi:CDP-glycerol glycerophosphotransferase (TagB/SpsB family)